MTAVITTAGKIRALTLLTTDMTHIGFGKPDPAWSSEFTPDAEDPSDTALVNVVGYAKIHTRGWLVEDVGGSIVIDGTHYSVSVSPTSIAYVSATIPSGQAEGVGNKIGQVGVFGQNVVTSPSNADWVIPPNITTAGTMYRIQHLPVYIKPSNSVVVFTCCFPLLG